MRLYFFHRLLLRWRIEDYSDGLDPTARDFERMIVRLKGRHKMVSSEDLRAVFDREESPDPDWVHLSFDDGFASTLVAAEICARHQVPLTVFVSSEVLHGFVPWFVTMRHAIASARAPVDFRGQRYDPRDPRGAMALNDRIKDIVYASPAPPGRALREILESSNLDNLPPLPEKHRFMTRDELSQLCSLGAEVGSHGASHRVLTGLAPEELDSEVRGSCKVLKDVMTTEVKTLSYPDGRFDQTTIEALRGAGLELGFAVGPQQAHADRFVLCREWLGRHVEHVGREKFQGIFRIWDRARLRTARVRWGH